MSCKTMSIDLANVPPVPIRIGVAGENSFRTITFDASKWGADYPDATYTVVYRRSDGYLYPVLVNASADAIVWSPTETDTAVSGNGQLEVRLLDGETIGKTIIMQTYVAPSLSGDESEPSTPAPDWVNDVAADADRAEAAVSHYPKIVNGVWYVWDAVQGEFVSTGISAQGEDGVSPTVTVTAIEGGHRVTITDTDGAHTFDVMDGDSAAAENAVLYTEQALTSSQKAQARGNVGAGTYSKPSTGIPKTDLASDVQTSLGKADTALQQHQSLTGYATETWVNGKGYQTAQDVNTNINALREQFGDTVERTIVYLSLNAGILAVNLMSFDEGNGGIADFAASYFAGKNALFLLPARYIDASDTTGALAFKIVGADTNTAQSTYLRIVSNYAGKVYAATLRPISADAMQGAFEVLDYQTASDVQTAISPLQSKAITDTGGYYTTDTVDGALQEIGAELSGINTLIGSGVIT